ncbi:MAG: hypothetical protein GY702_01555 [Desulfobulbaceae bacterium]|nr:hypothetical protein [Desulfobulbaceae bacterium]
MENWQPQNKEWMKKRKQLWKTIKKNLQDSYLVNRDDIKICEKYFLTGEKVDIVYGIVPELLKCWFHPDHSDENWWRILTEGGRGRDYESARWQVAHEVTHFAHDFGWMGGLEDRVIRFFFPDPDPAATVVVLGETVSVNPRDPVGRMARLGEWLTVPASSPYYYEQYLLEHIWRGLALIKPNDRVFNEGWSATDRFEKVLSQCANYIDPQAMPGEDTPQCRLATK